ncbi:MAG: shikimate dehydrogenase [Capnocytophaga sp.]|nr:shikimate dehydrogenase [Capnocytophaga sp.]
MDNIEAKKYFALVGRNISYSFSRKYFSEKFEKEHITNTEYINFDIASIEELIPLVSQYQRLAGMNVTIPYKEEIIPFLSELDETAQEIGAVNTIKILEGNKLKGYNTDYYGFSKSLEPYLQSHHNKALILGTGGASKAVAYALKNLGIEYRFVSRNPQLGQLSYTALSASIMEHYTLLINTTPVGTYPNVADCPSIPYEYISEKHLLYDLIYNPEKTTFLKNGETRKATIANGYPMLVLQAEKAWEIWGE